MPSKLEVTPLPETVAPASLDFETEDPGNTFGIQRYTEPMCVNLFTYLSSTILIVSVNTPACKRQKYTPLATSRP